MIAVSSWLEPSSLKRMKVAGLRVLKALAFEASVDLAVFAVGHRRLDISRHGEDQQGRLNTEFHLSKELKLDSSRNE